MSKSKGHFIMGAAKVIVSRYRYFFRAVFITTPLSSGAWNPAYPFFPFKFGTRPFEFLICAQCAHGLTPSYSRF
jgi:hypothetical protein